MFLTAEATVELTGYKRQTKQREWLVRHGIPFESNRFGKPVILIESLKESMGNSRRTHTVGIDLDALKEVVNSGS